MHWSASRRPRARVFESRLNRRRRGELLADYNCRDLLPVVESMLALDPGNAAAYRLRGIVAELESREMDAIADYAQASHLLRTGGDRFLPQTPEVRAGYADGLDDWRIALELAGGLSLLHADGDGPTCR